MSHCLFTVTFSVYTAQKAASEPDLSCSEQAASRRSENSKLPTGQLFVFLSVYVWEFRSMLWQPRSNGWRLQMWKGEQKPNRCFTLQFVATNWRACVSLSMCVQEYTVLYTGVLYQCVLIPAQLYRLCVTACVYVFFCRVCSASVLKTEEPTWFQPPVGLMAFEEMKCLLSSTHAAALICCPLKIHTHTHKHKSHTVPEILFKGAFKIAKCPDNSSVLIESFFGE